MEDTSQEENKLKELLNTRERQLVGMMRELADINYRLQQVYYAE